MKALVLNGSVWTKIIPDLYQFDRSLPYHFGLGYQCLCHEEDSRRSWYHCIRVPLLLPKLSSYYWDTWQKFFDFFKLTSTSVPSTSMVNVLEAIASFWICLLTAFNSLIYILCRWKASTEVVFRVGTKWEGSGLKLNIWPRYGKSVSSNSRVYRPLKWNQTEPGKKFKSWHRSWGRLIWLNFWIQSDFEWKFFYHLPTISERLVAPFFEFFAFIWIYLIKLLFAWKSWKDDSFQ